MFTNQTADTQAKESAVAMQVSVLRSRRIEHAGGKLRGTRPSGDASDRCHIMVVKLPKELCASQTFH